MIKTAILIDGAFFLKRYRKLYQKDNRNPEKVAKVKDWLMPKTPKEVHSFVELASYYRRFIPNFGKWAGPLHAVIVLAENLKR